MASFPVESNVCFSLNLGFGAANTDFTPKSSFCLKRSSLNTQFRPLGLCSRRSSRARASNTVIKSGYDSSTTEAAEPESELSVKPVYMPTPWNRELRTPHSGYHFDGSTRNFFEGWYFKVSIPQRKQSFCFMYSVENPAFKRRLSILETAQHGPRFTGVGAQILGADDKYICQYTEESYNFWGNRHELMLGNGFISKNGSRPPNKEVPPQEFNERVLEGFQVSPMWHQGCIRDDGRIWNAVPESYLRKSFQHLLL